MLLSSSLALGLAAVQASAFHFIPRPPPPPQGGCGEIDGPQDLRTLLLGPGVQWTAGTDVTFPEDGDVFVNVTDRWSPYSAPTYVAAISPASEQDVVQAVRIARANNIEFMATGGRHGYVTGFGRLQNGLAIDLHQFDSVEINEEAATLTIGGGVRARDITSRVGQAGFELPLGGCSCPGLVGVTIGGGITNWLGVHGLIIDFLLHVRLVTADGEVVEASETVNPDLFWGIRGAGANFGIILSATYQLSPPTNNNEIHMIETVFPGPMNESYYNALEQVMRVHAPALSLNSVAAWDFETNTTVLIGNFHYLGPVEEALEILAPILSLNPPVYQTHVVPWSEYHSRTLFGSDEQNCVPGIPHNPFGALTRDVSVPTLVRSFNAMAQFYNDYPTARTSSLIYHSYTPEAAMSVPDEATAYSWRDAVNYMYVLIIWTPDENAAATERAGIELGLSVRADFAETSGYGGLVSYINFAQGDETIEQVYGEHKLPRLSQLKATWDPDNVFRYHFPIPTSYP